MCAVGYAGSTCSVCAAGYSGPACATCTVGYFANAGLCSSCTLVGVHCTQCSDGISCSACAPGTTGPTCSSCVTGHNGTNCDSCLTGYYMLSSVCTLCSTINVNCLACAAGVCS